MEQRISRQLMDAVENYSKRPYIEKVVPASEKWKKEMELPEGAKAEFGIVGKKVVSLSTSGSYDLDYSPVLTDLDELFPKEIENS